MRAYAKGEPHSSRPAVTKEGKKAFVRADSGEREKSMTRLKTFDATLAIGFAKKVDLLCN